MSARLQTENQISLLFTRSICDPPLDFQTNALSTRRSMFSLTLSRNFLSVAKVRKVSFLIFSKTSHSLRSIRLTYSAAEIR